MQILGNDGGNDSPHTPASAKEGMGGKVKLYAPFYLDLKKHKIVRAKFRQFPKHNTKV